MDPEIKNAELKIDHRSQMLRFSEVIYYFSGRPAINPRNEDLVYFTACIEGV